MLTVSALSTSHVVADAIKHATGQLAASATPRLDAEVLLAHVLKCDRAGLYRDADRALTDAQFNAYQRLIQCRGAGRPVAQIIGRSEFWSLEFIVDPTVLVPRPETELVVETALELIPANGRASIVDAGTGSGAIAAALAIERPRARLIALDISAAAVAIARRNFARHRLRDILVVRADWLTPIADGALDLVVANPPYIAHGDPLLRTTDIRFEPLLALDGGPDGLDCMRSLTAEARRCLCPGGYLIVEHGYDQADPVQHLLVNTGFGDVRTKRDLAGHQRLSYGHA